ncbi:RsmB/NOP family class I SAM-dependent RNA methyltransferase [Sphingorhabdus arenilitoris]|uniref:RsmB/NOP family class I SAM-dependent RNA methyltransferase n=1 Tax=Sphingorhabdus arenilitoris TaxID=1490041 RepID=A0ABV8REV9_9SPHN
MRPAARLQAAITLLDEIIAAARDGGASADMLASAFFRARRYAGSKDRRAIRDLTWSAIRRFGERPATARSAFAAMADADAELAALFDGSDYGPAVLTADEPRAVGGVIPDWIKSYLPELLDEAEITALLGRAPLDLRVNRLQASVDIVMTALPEAQRLALCDDALRLPTGFPIEKHALMTDGHVDIQDVGSQLIAAACRAESGMTILDLCAGAGGKTLALAAHMGGKGTLIAADINRDRLAQLGPRAQRAGAGNVETRLLNPKQEAAMLSDYTGQCDVVLIDAPCSGSGTWRRNPETRWRLNESRLGAVVAEQARIMEYAAKMVRPAGHLVYAVCSLLEVEGAGQIAQFLSANPGWKAQDPAIRAGRASGEGIILTPFHDGSDGFFMARLQKL